MAIIQQPSGPGLTQTLLEILVNKQRQEQAQADLKIRQQDLKLRQEEQARQQELQRAQMLGAQAAAQLFSQTLGQPAQTAAGALPEALQNVPGAGQAAFIENFLGLRSGFADTRDREVGTRVAEATEEDTVSTVQSDARRAAADADVAVETRDARVRSTEAGADLAESNARVAVATERPRITQEEVAANLALAKQNNDPERVNGAWRAVVQGAGTVTWGQAADAFGIDPVGFGPEFMLPPPITGEGGGGEQARKAASLYSLMTASNATINQLYDEGVEIGGWGSAHRSSKNWFTNYVTGLGVDDTEGKLIQAQKTFADAYRFFISGQQSSDAEAERLLFTVLENPGDGPETVGQKRFMRDLIIQMTESIAGGTLNAGQAADRITAAARNRGLPQDQIAIFEQQAADAWAYTERGGWQASEMMDALQSRDPEAILDAFSGGP